MTHGATSARKAVNMTLSEDLVREARHLTPNLSETVEQLLRDFVTRERTRLAEREQQTERTIDLAIALYERHGIAGEEFSPLWCPSSTFTASPANAEAEFPMSSWCNRAGWTGCPPAW